MAIKTTVKSLAPISSGGALFIDPTNALTRGLQSAIVGGQTRDLVLNSTFKPVTQSSNRYGLAFDVTSGATSFQTNLNASVFTDQVSVVAVTSIRSAGFYPMVYSTATTGGSGSEGFELRFSDNLGWPSFYADGGRVSSFITTNLVGTGYRTIAGVYDGSNISVYLDNYSTSNQNACTGTIPGISSTPRVGARNGGPDFPIDASIPVILVWNRALKQNELESILRDPWQVVTRRRTIPYFPAEATAPSASTTLTGATASASAGTLSAATTRISTTTLTGSTASAAAGTLTAAAQVAASTTLTGASASGAAGTLSASASAAGTVSTTLTGATASGAAGTLAASATRVAATTLTGATASGAAGNLSAVAGSGPSASTALTGATASSAAGTLVAAAVRVALTTLTGATAAGAAGTLVGATGTGPSASTSLIGASASAAAGTLTAVALSSASIALIGATSTGYAGTLLNTAIPTASTVLTGASASASAGTLGTAMFTPIPLNAWILRADDRRTLIRVRP